LFLCVINIAGVYGPTIFGKGWQHDWLYNWLEELFVFFFFYFFLFPIMSCLFTACFLSLLGIHTIDWHKSIVDPQTWHILALTARTYSVPIAIGLIWRAGRWIKKARSAMSKPL